MMFSLLDDDRWRYGELLHNCRVRLLIFRIFSFEKIPYRYWDTLGLRGILEVPNRFYLNFGKIRQKFNCVIIVLRYICLLFRNSMDFYLLVDPTLYVGYMVIKIELW